MGSARNATLFSYSTAIFNALINTLDSELIRLPLSPQKRRDFAGLLLNV